MSDNLDAVINYIFFKKLFLVYRNMIFSSLFIFKNYKPEKFVKR